MTKKGVGLVSPYFFQKGTAGPASEEELEPAVVPPPYKGREGQLVAHETAVRVLALERQEHGVPRAIHEQQYWTIFGC